MTLDELDKALDRVARRYELSIYGLRNDSELIRILVNDGYGSEPMTEYIQTEYARELAGEM
jgi:hypothetical protein